MYIIPANLNNNAEVWPRVCAQRCFSAEPFALSIHFPKMKQEGTKRKSCVNFGPPAQNTPPPPKTPFLTPHTNEKGVNLLKVQAAICLRSSYAKYCNT